MSKKKKVSDFQKNRIKKFIKQTIDSSEEIEYEQYNSVELYELSREKNVIKKFKNNGNFSFFKIKYNNATAIYILIVLEFDYKDKDSIKINEYIVKSIDTLEKTLICLDKVNIVRHNNYKMDKHYILINIIKTIDEKTLSIISKIDDESETTKE